MSQYGHEDDSLFDELLSISGEIDHEIELAQIAENSLIELKSHALNPIFDEYYSGDVFFSVLAKGAKKPRLKDPKGGLTAAGRAYFKRKEGANLKPGVMGAANTPEKMRRKGSFLTRFFTNPSGPMKDEKGRATRLALSAAAWGEPVPQNAEDAAKLAAKGRRLLERYSKTKKKGLELNSFVFNPSAKNLDYAGVLSAEEDMRGLQSFDGEFDVYQPELTGDAYEIETREMLAKQVAKLSASDVREERIIPDDAEAISRMGKAAEFMEARRKKAKKIKVKR
jgi:hypothetical protein